ncbi:tRNA (guanine(10)-N2)-methyltransferase homolog [Seriola lalandi dorsalis]|uniref:tRNA (guanine(10)-N(2))-methyltransferase TRMT11 n=1 Tax=Seriola lalandi dorsalis TaxID=1841481 RepID=A0A3B4XK03_SERLL|nr:tRNA (guanine(10)-N2)-methyltransferase homolog [Seriola lalandi dorsalis]XP_056235701.1 tRNA (guanine(10)-N2)-methyltransferase homolog [Seriola aureovittata]
MMAASSSRSCLQYVFHLAQDNLDFRLPEILALLALREKPFHPDGKFKEKSPYWCLNGLSEVDVRAIMARSVCAKSAFELWGHGHTQSELRTSLLNYPLENMAPFMHKDSKYKINVYTFNKTLLFADRIKRIDALDYLPFEGTVSLKNPQHIFCMLEDYGSDPNNIPEHPNYIYFGRWIADGQRELIRSHSVKNRHFIGNTSMDAGLSFIMANHAKVKENDLVYDPFVGTGSLLVACSHFGAYVCGTDIDYNTIHGKGRSSRINQKWRGPDENIRANLRQYGIEKMYLDVMVSDASKSVWREAALFDAIITDPPYGIRESTRRTGSHKEITKPADGIYAESHVPVTQAYHLSDIFTDLLNFSAHHLVLGGRLVYWLPVYRPEYCEEMVPLNPCLQLISNCEQTLSSHTSRRLITMEKIKEPEDLDSMVHLADPRFSPYQGHNAFREKYFSGLNKRRGKEDNKSDFNGV